VNASPQGFHELSSRACFVRDSFSGYVFSQQYTISPFSILPFFDRLMKAQINESITFISVKRSGFRECLNI
jgi:hypothetical protein